MHSIESRHVKGPENILFAGMSTHLSAQKLYRLGGVKGLKDRITIVIRGSFLRKNEWWGSKTKSGFLEGQPLNHQVHPSAGCMKL